MPINSDFRGRVAEGAVGALLIIKAGAADMSCVVAAAATDKLLGTSDELDHVAGEMVDQAVGPVPKVRLGGVVAAGDALTSNAAGKAIATTTTGNRIIGFAEIAGVADDVITYLYAPGVV
ncbi:hypothetical protein J2W28_002059 [Variovorax boronicumulans]|uniref:DUF2190 domain-containing protein n=1 Tax=Variovorax boronicumulans TaxID=436515 RepID=UPI0027814B06|nr:DUF2190 domain-containing protein [Variovorax boronicumulans]MDP9990889.1 hypothetical protein [Variovorax boronicumulans]MDQ0002917.1 hypothetical protein [Variovorax boronicumulans]